MIKIIAPPPRERGRENGPLAYARNKQLIIPPALGRRWPVVETLKPLGLMKYIVFHPSVRSEKIKIDFYFSFAADGKNIWHGQIFGGDAMADFLAGKSLPGIKALEG